MHSKFPKGSVDGSGHVDVGGCLSEDVVASRIQQILSADPTLSALMTSIRRYDVAPTVVWDDVPLITITNLSIDPTGAPTRVALSEVDTAISVWHQFRDLDSLDPFEPSITSLLGHIEALLASNAMLPIDIQSGPTLGLQVATRGDAVARFNETFEINQDRYIAVREIVWRSQVTTNIRTGKVKEIEDNGG